MLTLLLMNMRIKDYVVKNYILRYLNHIFSATCVCHLIAGFRSLHTFIEELVASKPYTLSAGKLRKNLILILIFILMNMRINDYVVKNCISQYLDRTTTGLDIVGA